MMEKFLIGFLGSAFVLLAPVNPLVLLVGMFIVTDTIFGVFTSWYLGKDIVSRKLARLLVKLIMYTAGILLVFGLDTLILSHFIGGLIVTKLSAGALCFVEGFSIDEKIRMINGDKGIVYYLTRCFRFIRGVKKGFNDLVNGKDK